MTRTQSVRLPRRLALAAAIAAAALLAGPAPATAQGAFPSRPITLVVPFGPGGIADLTARAVGEAMSRQLGQPVVIDNRPSAGSIVATQAVTSAKADGHTLLLMSNGHAVSVGLFRKLPYDTQRDLAGVSTLGYFDLGLFVPAGSRFTSLAQLTAHAKAHAGQLNVGTIAVGSTQHLSAKLFETVASIDALVVPYKASPAVLGALRGAEVDVAFEIVGPMLPQVKAGVVRALAVTGARRNPALPDVPTVAESGLPAYDVASWNGIAAPAGTPAAVLARLNAVVRQAVADPAVQARLAPLGMRLAASSPAELDALLAREIGRWGGVIRAAGIQPE